MFTWWAFSSTTTDANVISDSAFTGKHGGRTVFSIDGIGVDIAAFSAFPNERELLILPGTSLTVQPGVKVEANCWNFEASVCQVVQQQEGEKQPHEKEEGKEEKERNGHEEGSGSVLRFRDNYTTSSTTSVSKPKARFQNVDLVHPDWESFV